MTHHPIPLPPESDTDDFGESPAQEPTYLPSFTGESYSAIPHVQIDPDRAKPWGLILLGIVALIIFVSNVEPFESRATRFGNFVSGANKVLPAVEPTGLLFCPGIDQSDEQAIERAAHEMQRTAEGGRLFRQLVFEKICVGAEDMEYAGAHTSYYSTGRGLYLIRIKFNPELIDQYSSEALAAVLIHEATHADRVLHKTACFQSGKCELLPNGVHVEEEVAAHGSEAEFWIELYGTDGKAVGLTLAADDGTRFLNGLVERYNRGPEKFRQYVRYIRSDPREADLSPTPTQSRP